MRRLETKQESERKKKRSMKIMSILMLGLMLSSVVGFAFILHPGFGASSSSTGGGGSRSGGTGSSNGLLAVNYGGQNFYLLSSQSAISNIPVEIEFLPEDYRDNVLYVSADNPEILREIASTLGTFSSRFQEACYGACEKDLPEIDCSGEDNLIVWKDSSENKVFQDGKCVFIEGDLRAVDAFLYDLFS
jgi:hypothetical protein